MKRVAIYTLLLTGLLSCISNISAAQATDSTSQMVSKDSINQPLVRNPKKAALFSTIVPGGGQIYNRKLWKLPIIYGALGAVVYLYFDNRSYYQDYREAYINDLKFEEPDYIPSSYALQGIQTAQLRTAADQSRQNMEYCMIGFAALYVLQIVDASVDAHLSSFDVSDDISLQWEPTMQQAQNQTWMTGIRMNFRF